jgi:hypothetical protein
MTAEERNKLVMDNKGIAGDVAKTYRIADTSNDDRFQVAIIGMMKAAETFDACKGDIKSHLWAGARNAVLNEWQKDIRRRRKGHVSRSIPRHAAQSRENGTHLVDVRDAVEHMVNDLPKCQRSAVDSVLLERAAPFPYGCDGSDERTMYYRERNNLQKAKGKIFRQFEDQFAPSNN